MEQDGKVSGVEGLMVRLKGSADGEHESLARGGATRRSGVEGCWPKACIVRVGQEWRCTIDGATTHEFVGVAFCEELECFVYTSLEAGSRRWAVLGSKMYEMALFEAEDFKKQMQLDL